MNCPTVTKSMYSIPQSTPSCLQSGEILMQTLTGMAGMHVRMDYISSRKLVCHKYCSLHGTDLLTVVAVNNTLHS